MSKLILLLALCSLSVTAGEFKDIPKPNKAVACFSMGVGAGLELDQVMGYYSIAMKKFTHEQLVVMGDVAHQNLMNNLKFPSNYKSAYMRLFNKHCQGNHQRNNHGTN